MVGMFVYAACQFHIILLLILLEMLGLSGGFCLRVLVCNNRRDPARVFIFMAIIAGAAGLGMALLSKLTRTHGDDRVMV